MQFTLFDPTAGRMLRDLGLASVEFNNLSFVQAARTVLDKLIEINGKATMDDVREVLTALNIEPSHVNAYGAVVKGGRYVCIGHCLSRNPSRRAGTQRVWAFAVPKLDPPPQGKQEKEEYYLRPRLLIKKPGWRKFQAYRAQY
jgi:hypothetical protein